MEAWWSIVVYALAASWALHLLMTELVRYRRQYWARSVSADGPFAQKIVHASLHNATSTRASDGPPSAKSPAV